MSNPERPGLRGLVILASKLRQVRGSIAFGHMLSEDFEASGLVMVGISGACHALNGPRNLQSALN